MKRNILFLLIFVLAEVGLYSKDTGTTSNIESKIEMVDIYKKLKPLLDDPGFVRIYTKSLRVMDLLNGCCRQCKFCYIDAGIPTKMISSESFIKLFSDSRFKQLLMDDSLRIGNSGDIADHPEAVKIVSFLLKEFPQKKLRILSNYRHRDKDKIMELVNLARVYNKDSNIPFNLMLSIGEENIEAFYNDFKDVKGFKFDSQKYLSKIEIPGLEFKPLFSLTNDINKLNSGRAFLNPSPPNETDLFFFYEDSGNSKTILNADGFLLYEYVTLLESRNAKSYTEIKPSNYEKLAQAPFHPDFKTPPNWPGGRGERKKLDANFQEHCKTFFELLKFDNPNLKIERLKFK